jgi:hypothetical protein
MKEFSLAKKFNWELAHKPIQTPPIIIPTPKIKIYNTGGFAGENPVVQASYLPYSDSVSETFKKYNPKFYLFRESSVKVSSKRVLGDDTIRVHVRKSKAFVHPTHMNGINFPANTPIYGGNTRIPLHTEYELGNINPYEYTTLPFDPYEFVEYNDFSTTPGWVPMTSANWGNVINFYRFTGKKNKKENPAMMDPGQKTKSAKSILFKIAIGIDNPTGSKTNPILFGEFSDTFRLQLVGEAGDVLRDTINKFTIQLQHSSVTTRK